jgi:hypothetical protein
MDSKFSRRSFCVNLLLATTGLLSKDLLFPTPANANESLKERSFASRQTIEKYLVFVPYTIARQGGTQVINLYSGKPYSLSITNHFQDGRSIKIRGAGEQGSDLEFEIHTLYDSETRIADQIYKEIENTQFIESTSKTKCKLVYQDIEDGKFVEDIEALELLDYVVSSSKLDQNICQRYQLASNNSRLVGITQAIDAALATSNFTEKTKNSLRGTFELVKAGQPITDFNVLTQLDSIVLSSNLSDSIKQSYVLGSAVSGASTVDYLIVNKIGNDKRLSSDQKKQYLEVYQEVRDGKPSTDVTTLNQLDSYILSDDNLSANARLIYQEARHQASVKGKNLIEQISQLKFEVSDFKNLTETATENASKLLPQTTKLLSEIGIKAGTGISIGSLSGAAATNATLAWLGGGSVASGGFGMLGGLAVVTGGAALIGAAGIISLALFSQMDQEDQKNIGVAVGGGTIAGASTLLIAWMAASTFGIAETLSGAAATSAVIAALGGLSVMTGGTALIASGAAYLIWSFLKSNKKREQGYLEQLESRIYTLTEEPQLESLAGFITQNIQKKYFDEKHFTAPELPLDKLSNVLKSWVEIESDEKVITLIDTSFFSDAKEGIIFTDQRVIWKRPLDSSHSLSYKDLNDTFEQKIGTLLIREESRHNLNDLIRLSDTLPNQQEHQKFTLMLEEIVGKYVSLYNSN